jgi:plasmid maintenance system antidote protein VapI
MMSAENRPSASGHGWFAQQWLKTMRKSQADACRALGWSKATASDLVSGKQRYNQDAVEGLASFLQISPYELLMHPQDAMSLRQLRNSAEQIARITAIRDAFPVGGGSPREAADDASDITKPRRKAG